MAKRKRKRKGWTACAHCGKPGETFERDHVPPKGLFDNSENLVVVPWCSECYPQAAKDEEYFRAMLLSHHHVGEHPEAKKVMPTFWRSLERPDHKKFLKTITSGLKMTDIFTPLGLWAGKVPVYQPNEKRMTRVVQKIVRGLYWHHFGNKPLPKDWDVWVCWQKNFPEAKQQMSHANIVAALQSEPPRVLGKGVFRYSYAQASDVPEGSVWLMKFYEAIEFFCATVMSDQLYTALKASG